MNDGPDTAPPPVEDVGDDDTLANARAALASGHFSIEEAKKTWALSDDEVAQLAKPAANRLTVQQELEALDKLRKENPKAYWAEETQAKEIALIRQQEQQKKVRAEAAKPSGETADRLTAIDKELAAIEAIRRENRRSYDHAAQDRELELLREKEALRLGTGGLSKELLEEFSETGGVEHNLTNARTSATGILDKLNEAEKTTLAQGFDELPQAALLAVDPSDKWREASTEDVERFKAEAPEQAELIAEWGEKAPKKLGAVLGRVRALQRTMKPADADAAMAWFQSLSASQSKAVLRHLAGKR